MEWDGWHSPRGVRPGIDFTASDAWPAPLRAYLADRFVERLRSDVVTDVVDVLGGKAHRDALAREPHDHLPRTEVQRPSLLLVETSERAGDIEAVSEAWPR